MRAMWTMLAAVTLTTGAALAQVATTTTTAVCPPVVGLVTTPVAAVTCPTGSPNYPTPCAAKLVTGISGEPMVMILGTEERYALDNLGAKHLNWTDISGNANSVFDQTNPLLNHRPNGSLMRHGNPYYPYYELPATSVVAGIEERYMALPATMTTQDRATLQAVADRYRGLTTQQAVAMGYQPIGAGIPNIGYVYVNQAMIDNRFDPLMPEALAFNDRGRIVAVHYILLSDVPFMAFGQQFQPSPLVQGATQLPVWLYMNNRNGMFTLVSQDRLIR